MRRRETENKGERLGGLQCGRRLEPSKTSSERTATETSPTGGVLGSSLSVIGGGQVLVCIFGLGCHHHRSCRARRRLSSASAWRLSSYEPSAPSSKSTAPSSKSTAPSSKSTAPSSIGVCAWTSGVALVLPPELSSPLSLGSPLVLPFVVSFAVPSSHPGGYTSLLS